MTEEREVVLGGVHGPRRARVLTAACVALVAVGLLYARLSGTPNDASPSTTAVAEPPSTATLEPSSPSVTVATTIAVASPAPVTSAVAPGGSAVAGVLSSVAMPGQPGVLWALSRTAGEDVVLTRVDLRVGSTLQWPLASEAAAGPLGRDLVPFAEGAVVVDDHRLTWYPATGGRPIELTFTRPGVQLLRVGDAEAWLVGSFDRVVLRASLTGQFVIKSAGFALPEGFVAVSALPDESIVGWSLYGGTYRVDRTGAVSRLSAATLTNASADGRHGVGLGCNASLQCGAVRLDLVTGTSAPSPVTAADPFGWGVSPDGRWLALADGPPSLANLVTGEVVGLDLANDARWVGFSADGRWCLVVTDTRLRRVPLSAPGSATVESIDLGFIGRIDRVAVGPEPGP